MVELFSATAFVPALVHERLPPCIFVNDLATRDQVPPAVHFMQLDFVPGVRVRPMLVTTLEALLV